MSAWDLKNDMKAFGARVAQVQGDDDDDWDDDEVDVQCLFSEQRFTSVGAAVQHAKDKYDFDIQKIRSDLKLDQYGLIRMVNFIRSQVAAQSGVAAIRSQVYGSAPPFLEEIDEDSDAADSNNYLKPFLPDDPMLFFLDDALGGFSDADQSMGGTETKNDDGVEGSDDDDDDDDVPDLVADSQIQAEEAESNGTGKTPDAEEEEVTWTLPLSAEQQQQLLDQNRRLKSQIKVAEQKLQQAVAVVGNICADDKNIEFDPEKAQDNDTYYFDSYSHLAIHREMLSDRVRTESYRRALECNPSLFNGATVLDVGCGTGILSLFAARGGAKRVVGIDMSELVPVTRKVIAANGMSERISIVKGKAEEVQLPTDVCNDDGGEDGCVDVIISEWMGYCLLYECMLETVLRARDRWLKKGGVVLPNRMVIVLEGIEESQWDVGALALSHGEPSRPFAPRLRGNGKWQGMRFWDEVYGLDMKAVSGHATKGGLVHEPTVEVVPASAVCTERCDVQNFDVCTMTIEDLDFEAPYKLVLLSPVQRAQKAAAATAAAPQPAPGAGAAAGEGPKPVVLSAVCVSFDTHFDESGGCKECPVEFRTDPASPYTHWKQTVLHLPKSLQLYEGDSLEGSLRIRRNHTNPRELDVRLTGTIVRSAAAKESGVDLGIEEFSQHYHMD